MAETTGAANPSGPNEVAIIVARTNFERSMVEVVAFSKSVGAPMIAPGGSCAEAIATLLEAQFTVGNVAIGGNPTVTEYLMTRPRNA